jgi:hypothetical protein
VEVGVLLSDADVVDARDVIETNEGDEEAAFLVTFREPDSVNQTSPPSADSRNSRRSSVNRAPELPLASLQRQRELEDNSNTMPLPHTSSWVRSWKGPEG